MNLSPEIQKLHVNTLHRRAQIMEVKININCTFVSKHKEEENALNISLRNNSEAAEHIRGKEQDRKESKTAGLGAAQWQHACLACTGP